MSVQPPSSPLLDTTEEAVLAAKAILRLARFGTLATLEAGTGYPLATRTNVATSLEGNPVFLLSDLAAHTKAIKADPRTSLLVGEPGKGDPLAHPRLTLLGKTSAVPVGEGTEKVRETTLRRRYISRHPKADLYNQLPDFFIYELKIERALFNAGFGKAYEIEGTSLTLNPDETEALLLPETEVLSHMNEDHGDAIEAYAVNLCGQEPGQWRLSGIDPEGADLMLGDKAARLPFETMCHTRDDIRIRLVDLAKKAKNV